MSSCATLPEGYQSAFSIDLQKDKKLALLVNVIGVLIMLVVAVPVHFIVPVSTLFDMSAGFGPYILRFGVLLVGLVAYVFAHEAVHGVFMKRFSGVKPSYGFTGMYAYAGSTAYFCKKDYIIIALSPIVIWGIVLAALCCVVPREWFWVAYFIQVMNLSGAAGDLYVTWRFRTLPGDILVNDTGVSMTVFMRV